MDDLIRRAREALVDVTPGPWKAVAAGQAADLNEVVRREPFQSIAAARDLVPAMADRLEAQEALLKEAVAALRFYADEQYDGYDVCITDYGLSTENGPIITDGGDRARATLAKMRAHLGETK